MKNYYTILEQLDFKNFYSYNAAREYDELGTFVPYFDTNFDKNTFLTFVPYKSAKIGSGAKEYKLVKIDPTNKKRIDYLGING